MFDGTFNSPFGEPTSKDGAQKFEALQDLLLIRQYQILLTKPKKNITWPRIDSGTRERDARVLDTCYILISIYPQVGG